MPTILSNVWASIGIIGTVLATGTGLAYWIFKLFSEKWLTQKFSERLEDYRHAQQRELENLRLQISSTLDRTSKLHQAEFDILPKLWQRLSSAYGEVWAFTSPLQSLPDLNRMKPAELAEFLDNSELAGWQKLELHDAEDKTKTYDSMAFWHKFNRVNRTYYEFNNYLITSGIFISRPLKERFQKLRDLMHGALSERRLEEEYPDPRPGRFECGDKFREEGDALMNEIEEHVQGRLWETPLKVNGLEF
jgi:hypothetical protein